LFWFWQNEEQLSYLMKELEYDTEMLKARADAVNIDEVSSSNMFCRSR
jgi:hypothetical protein